MTQKKPTNRVLSDHKQQGKKFIPPMMQIGMFSETSWVRTVLPEFIGLALLNHRFGLRRGAELSISLSGAALSAIAPEKRWFGAVSSFANLTNDQKKFVRKHLQDSEVLLDIQEALADLVSYYPDCPLAFLFQSGPQVISQNKLSDLKLLVEQLLDKRTKAAMFAQANAIYVGFVSDLLKVKEGLALARFPEIQDYPDTEKSREVGAAIRAAIFGLFVIPPKDIYEEWPRYFWNRGLQLEKCTFTPIHAQDS